MSEEEKKAIEKLEIEGTENNLLEVRILLNLVDKQEQEIEELKDKYVLYADKTDIDFLLSVIEMQQKQIDNLKGITEDDLPF